MTEKEDRKYRDSGQLRADLSYNNDGYLKATTELDRERALFGVLQTIGHALVNIGDELYRLSEKGAP